MTTIRNLFFALRNWNTDRKLAARGIPTMAEFYAGQGR